MVKSKPLSQLGQDLRGALELGMETATYKMVTELKERGPYYTGAFEAAWVVKQGRQLIASNQQRTGTDPKPRPAGPTAFVVPLPQIEQGYTVANEMEYADIAMDLEPGADQQYRYERFGATAGRDWFERYMLGGDLSKDIENSVTEGFRIAGFK